MVGGIIKRLQTHKKFEYIVYKAHKENIGSRKIAEHFGATLQLNESGQENVFIDYKFDEVSGFPSVEYRIYNK